MASPVTLHPNGNGTFSLNWGGTGTPSGDYTQVKDGSDSTYGSCGGNSQSSFYLFDDLPVEAVTITGCDYSWRTADSGKSPARKFSTIQLVQSNEVTALTNAADVSGTSASATTQTGSFTLTGATDAATWNGLRIKMTTASTGSGTAFLYEVSLTVTYTTASGRIHRAAGLAGLGGVGQQLFNPVLRSLPIWTPPQKTIFVPAFTLAK